MQVIDLDRGTIRRGLEDNSILLIDVREAHEFESAHIPGSVSHPLSGFDPAELAALIRADGRRPVLSCAAGVRSAHALMAAQRAGLTLAEHYAGGFKDWCMAGEPVA